MVSKMTNKHPANKTKDILDYIISNNVLEFIKENDQILSKIYDFIVNKESKHILMELYNEGDADSNTVFEKLLKYDSYSANHGLDVENKCLSISRYLTNYEFDENLPDAARLHDLGKILIPNELKFKEEYTGTKLQLHEKISIQYGHTLLGESIGILCGLHPAIIHASACHHDKHPEFSYPHKSIEKVLEIPLILNKDEYNKKYNNGDIKRSTEIVTLSNDIISIADTVCSMRDKKRKSYDKEYTNKEIYNEILNRCSNKVYDKNVVKAFLKSEGLDLNQIHNKFEEYKIK